MENNNTKDNKENLDHDGVFKKSLEHKKVAKQFCEAHLPDYIKEIVDLDTLEMDKETYIEQVGNRKSSDVLFKTKFDGQDGFIYVLCENQSSLDYWMPYRFLKYMMCIWDQYRAKNPESELLPPIYPLLFYNGKQKYTYPKSLFKLFNNPELAKKCLNSIYNLVDITTTPDNKIKEKDWLALMELSMKYIREKDLKKRLKKMGVASIMIKLVAKYVYGLILKKVYNLKYKQNYLK
jgi:predicted transposase/invertase (TIGR01784 family)